MQVEQKILKIVRNNCGINTTDIAAKLFDRDDPKQNKTYKILRKLEQDLRLASEKVGKFRCWHIKG